MAALARAEWYCVVMASVVPLATKRIYIPCAA